MGLLKALAKAMKTADDPGDWVEHLSRLVNQLPEDAANHLPQEPGFIIGLRLSDQAAATLHGKLGLPEDILAETGDQPDAMINLISFVYESRTMKRRAA